MDASRRLYSRRRKRLRKENNIEEFVTKNIKKNKNKNLLQQQRILKLEI